MSPIYVKHVVYKHQNEMHQCECTRRSVMGMVTSKRVVNLVLVVSSYQLAHFHRRIRELSTFAHALTLLVLGE